MILFYSLFLPDKFTRVILFLKVLIQWLVARFQECMSTSATRHPCCRYLSRYIYVFSTPTEHILVTVSGRDHIIIWCNQQLEQCQYAPTFGHDDLWLCVSTATDEQFGLPNFTHKAWVNLWYVFHALSKGAEHWDCLPQDDYINKSTS